MDAHSLELATQLRDLLRLHKRRLVLAESCTGGRVAATLAVLPGISQWLCGSFVVYRNASKSAWLGVPADVLDDPRIGPVSLLASRWLAQAALAQTAEADIAIAVTGDVGPGAAVATDGMIYIAAAVRQPHAERKSESYETSVHLNHPEPRDALDVGGRLERLEEATRCVLSFTIRQLELGDGTLGRGRW